MPFEVPPVTTTGVAEGQKTPYQAMLAYEEMQVHCTRTDAGTTDPMYIGVFASIDDGTTESDSPLMVYAMEAADKEKGFGVSGPYSSIAIGILSLNATDASVATIITKRNGGP